MHRKKEKSYDMPRHLKVITTLPSLKYEELTSDASQKEKKIMICRDIEKLSQHYRL